MSASMPWVKLYTEFLDDPKLGALPDSAKLRFIQLVLIAGECDADGCLLAGDKPLTTKEIAWRLRLDAAQLEADLLALIDSEVLADEHGTLCVINFTKRQGRPQGERQRRWRENQKAKRAKDKESENDDEIDADDVSSNDKKRVIDDTTMTLRPRGEKRREEERREVAASPPPITPPKKEKLPRTPDAFFDYLAELTASLPAVQGGYIAKTKKALADGGATVDDLRAFANWWETVYWPEKKKGPPTLNQITTLWGHFKRWQSTATAKQTAVHNIEDMMTLPNGKVVKYAD